MYVLSLLCFQCELNLGGVICGRLEKIEFLLQAYVRFVARENYLLKTQFCEKFIISEVSIIFGVDYLLSWARITFFSPFFQNILFQS